MSEEPSQQGATRSLSIAYANPRPPSPHPSRPPSIVAFDRGELTTILNVYGRRVAEGEWRDYAMDFQRDRAVFSIFRHASERPLFMVEKQPKLRNRQGMYVITGQDGRILRRGHELATVLKVLEPRLALVR